MAGFRNRKNWDRAQRSGWSKRFAHFSKIRRIREMVRRANPQRIKIHRNYTIEEAAETLAVSVPTVRNWIKDGLPALTSKRRFLLLGPDIRNYLQEKRQTKRTKLKSGQMYCLPCRKAHYPDGMIADYVPRNQTHGKLVGLCPACGTICNRFSKKADLPGLAAILDIAVKGDG